MKKKNNKIYYHYCSLDTFYNILQTGTIRFGNPLNMNDSAEIIWLLEMVKDFVLKRGVYNSILEGWNLIENISRTLLQEMDCPYIFCLSKDKDVLSQWRSYANDGKGVAIGFNVDFIVSVPKTRTGFKKHRKVETKVDYYVEKASWRMN